MPGVRDSLRIRVGAVLAIHKQMQLDRLRLEIEQERLQQERKEREEATTSGS